MRYDKEELLQKLSEIEIFQQLEGKLFETMIFGKKIKEIREERGMLQRQMSAALEIDMPMYSKIEHGERKAKRSQIPIMAKLLDVEEKELLTIWLADKVLDTVEGEGEVKYDALVYAQREMEAEVG